MDIWEKLARCETPGELQRMCEGTNWELVEKGEIERLRAAGSDLVEWCRHERQLLGAIDGYDYDSGQEYGLRRAEIEIEKRLRALRSHFERIPEVPLEGKKDA